MIRIIDGVAYRGKPGSELKVKAHELGNGHLEVTASRVTEWQELEWSPSVVRDHLEMMDAYREEHADELRDRHAQQSARRAKKRVRQLCKALGADTMLTLTYRENQTDMALCKRHLKEFNRRILRVMPQFACVAAFERQDRGACHVHMATRAVPTQLTRYDPVQGKAVSVVNDFNARSQVKVKSYDVIRSVWRSVTGDLGGNIDVARRKFHSKRSAAQIAAYIAGYIVKEFTDGELWSNRWTKFGQFDVLPPVQLGTVRSHTEAVEVAFALIPAAYRVVISRLDRWKDWFVIHAEKGGGRPCS